MLLVVGKGVGNDGDKKCDRRGLVRMVVINVAGFLLRVVVRRKRTCASLAD